MDAKTGESIGGGCPVPHDGGIRALLGRTNKDWWPEMLATDILNPNGSTNPHGEDFDYAEAFNALDYDALKADLTKIWGEARAANVVTASGRSVAVGGDVSSSIIITGDQVDVDQS